MRSNEENPDPELQLTNVKRINESKGEWRSPIIRAEDGGVIGATLFFTQEDLEMLDIDTDSAEEVLYAVTESGSIHIKNYG
ncbi:hypothetical protein GCM10009647_084880 [Streptomyces sanglieri]